MRDPAARARSKLKMLKRELAISQHTFARLCGRAEDTIQHYDVGRPMPGAFAQWVQSVESIEIAHGRAVITLNLPSLAYRSMTRWERERQNDDSAVTT